MLLWTWVFRTTVFFFGIVFFSENFVFGLSEHNKQNKIEIKGIFTDDLLIIESTLFACDSVGVLAGTCDPSLVDTITNLFTNIDDCDSIVTIIIVLLPNEFCDSLATSNGVVEKSNERISSVYPNPFTVYTTLYFNKISFYKYDIILFDIVGNEVQRHDELTESSFRIERDRLESGLYILNIYEKGSYKLIDSHKLQIF